MSEPLTPAEIDEFADQVFDAIERGDVAAIESMWAADISVWHNTDGIAQTKDANLAVMRWMFGHTESREYRDVVRHVFSATANGGPGFAQRHDLALTFADGRTAVLPAAIFASIDVGPIRRISRIDEYLDAGQVAAAFERPV